MISRGRLLIKFVDTLREIGNTMTATPRIFYRLEYRTPPGAVIYTIPGAAASKKGSERQC
ncbi:MAG TPA: hypothetical protein GXZ36_00630 [Firmicutes bacterium]|nr:hypothetical protein [Bacillota bacterium]